MTSRPVSGARTRRGRHALDASRDQATSTFTQILARLVRAVPGAMGAALVDYEGETVDYAGLIDTFELKIAAAHWQIALREIHESASAVRQLTIRTRGRGYLVRQIHPMYTLVLVLHRYAAFAASERALQEADGRLCAEAGFDVPAARWFAVDVQTEAHDRSRPVLLRVAQSWEPIEVMGYMVGLKPRERGFRVRLGRTGAELLLVRERYGSWFADEHLDDGRLE